VLLFSTEGWSLPPCPGSPLTGSVTSNVAWWSNCEGTFIFGNKSKYAGFVYVGEYRCGKKHGQGTLTYLDGRVQEGIFENGKFLYAKKTPPRAIAMRRNYDRLREIEIEVLG
jgi:hypothetical protein